MNFKVEKFTPKFPIIDATIPMTINGIPNTNPFVNPSFLNPAVSLIPIIFMIVILKYVIMLSPISLSTPPIGFLSNDVSVDMRNVRIQSMNENMIQFF
ncbi:MAG: hypothetical protein ACRDD7_04000 [Peptostreptococcaceae bacterium]